MSSEKLLFGVCKQVNHGDSIVVRERPIDGPPPTKVLGIANIMCPKMNFKSRPDLESSEDELFAWEAREFLRKQIIGKEICYTETKMPKGGVLGDIYIGKSKEGINVALLMVSEGYAEVRKINNPEVAGKIKNYQQLLDAENNAKAEGKGMWDQSSNVVPRMMMWNDPNVADYVESIKGKPMKGVVEYVRDGCSMAVCLFPREGESVYHQFMILLAGVKTPGFKFENQEQVPEKLAVEAKTFVELRLLQREVTVFVTGMNNQNLVGSVIHPNGDVANFLLQQGLAKIVEWTIDQVKDKLTYMNSESLAKGQRKGIWVDYKPPENIPKPQQQTTSQSKSFSSVIVEVGMGDYVIVKGSDGTYTKYFLSSIRSPRPPPPLDENGVPRPVNNSQIKPLYDIPFMFEAREFLRKQVGKKVTVKVDYTLPKLPDGPPNATERMCATILTQDGKNLAEGLLSRGLAQLVRHRANEPRSSHYDKLQIAEEEGKKKAVGLHSGEIPPPMKVNNLSGNPSRCKQSLPYYQRIGKMSGIVEFVPGGNRLRVYVPKDKTVLTLLCAGIICARNSRQFPDGRVEQGDPMGDEAYQFTKDMVFQRNIDFTIDSMDRGSNFIGYIHMPQQWTVNGPKHSAKISPQNVSSNLLNVALVLKGYATVHKVASASSSDHFKTLIKAENEARAAKNGLWGLEDFCKQIEMEEQEQSSYDADQVPVADTLDMSNLQLSGSGVKTAVDLKSSRVDPKSELADASRASKKRMDGAKTANIVMVKTADADSKSVKLHVQMASDMNKIREISMQLKDNPPSTAECTNYKPSKGQMCAAKYSFDGCWYRAQVLHISGPKVVVQYIDFGNEETIDRNANKYDLGPLNAKLSSMPVVTKQYRLAGVLTSPDLKDKEMAGNYIMEKIGDSQVRVAVDSSSPVPTDREDKKALPTIVVYLGEQDLGEDLLSSGYVYTDRARLSKDLRLKYDNAQNEAKKLHKNIWMYGDCRPDE